MEQLNDRRIDTEVPSRNAGRPRRRRKLHRIASFPTTADAMAAEEICRSRGIDGRIIPLPGSVRADCGLAWIIPDGTIEAFREASEGNFTVAGIHEVMMYKVIKGS